VGIISIGGLILLFQDRQIKYQQSNLQPIVDGLKKENETLKAKVDELTKEANELKKTNAELENQTSQPMINRSVKGASIANPKNAVPNQVIDKQTTNLNTATATELDRLPGIGPVYTQRIIDYRDQHGGFKTIEEIQNVKGIGPKTFEKIEGMIGVE
jgi:competence protein ComEA